MISFGPLADGPISGPSDPSGGLDTVVTDGFNLADTARAAFQIRVAESFELVVGAGGFELEETVAELLHMVIGVGTPEFAADATEALSFSSLLRAMMHSYDEELLAGFRFEVFPAAAQARLAVIVDALGMMHAQVSYNAPVVKEPLQLTPAVVIGQKLHPVLLEDLHLVDAIFRGIVEAVAEVLELELDDVVIAATTLRETVPIAAALAAAAKRQVTTSEIVHLVDALSQFIGETVLDTVELGSELTGQARASRVIEEVVDLLLATTPQLLLHAQVEEGIELTPTDALRMLFAPELFDGVEISGGYLAPNGSFTTWAMNTRTAAVTEYSNWTFNSFARVGNKMLAASDTGLYALEGDDDDGTDIVARIKSGFMQFGGTKLSRLKAAYLAVRGEGDFVLRIIDGDDRTYDYAVETRNQRSTKVHMGKGQRSRYFAFELISAGQDFDLDTLEFVPIVVQRRV